jgi:hypothetical protein
MNAIRTLWLPLLGLLVFVAGGCATAEEAREMREERRARQAARARSELYVDLSLTAPLESVQSVQLYQGGNETALPILTPQSPELTLEFDRLRTTGGPLSIYFYHADRRWRRDLTPGEYLTGFQRDDLLDYSISIGTEVPYVHYRYRFPNDRIGFEVSGNYILRVTEQGDENAVLFEQPFYVAEQATAVDFGLENIMIGGQGSPSVQPIVFFRPPSGLEANVFDYNTCFVRNGRMELARCTSQPSLTQQPLLEFYLQPEASFEPDPSDYYVDLGPLRVGQRVLRLDRSASPFEVVLEPDYARFSGTSFPVFLNGQAVISGAVQNVADPDIAAEYVSVWFSFVPPDEQPFDAEVILTGSFNNWRIDPANQLTWVPEEGRYEVEMLLKQGAYEYSYFTRDDRLQRALRGNLPRSENQYTALVYYRDPLRNTDRLLAYQHVVTQ